jgi:hypothetical protein
MLSRPILANTPGVLALLLSTAGVAEAQSEPSPRTGSRAIVPYQPAPPPAGYAPSQLTEPCRAQAPEEPGSSWYGYQIMLADAASIGLGFATQRAEVLLAGFFIAPSVVHGLHRRPVQAVISPIARLVLPLIGMSIGSTFRNCNTGGDECYLGGMIYGTGIGVAAAMILDWSWAWSRPPVVAPHPTAYAMGESEDPSPAKSSGLAITTAGLAPTAQGVNLVLGGRF